MISFFAGGCLCFLNVQLYLPHYSGVSFFFISLNRSLFDLPFDPSILLFLPKPLSSSRPFLGNLSFFAFHPVPVIVFFSCSFIGFLLFSFDDFFLVRPISLFPRQDFGFYR